MAVSQTPRKKQTIWVVLGSSAAGILVIAGIVYGAIFLVQAAGKALNPSADGYAERFAQLESAPKNFAASETAQIGPYDVTVTNVQRNYTPSAAEQTSIDALKKSSSRSKISGKSASLLYGFGIPESSAQYLKISFSARTNQAREVVYDRLTSAKSIDWIQSFAYAEVQGYRPLAVQPAALEDALKPAEAKTAQGLPMSLLYRIDATAQDTTLKYTQSVYSRVSGIVGTEGMPSQTFTYTIRL